MPSEKSMNCVEEDEEWDTLDSAKSFIRWLAEEKFSPPKKQELCCSEIEPLSPLKKEAWEIKSGLLNVDREIGRGTFTTVYGGTYNGLPVAVKVLNYGQEESRAADRALFRQEIDVWSKLDHPNVTKFIGASMRFTTKTKLIRDGCIIVVEHLRGGSLKNYLIANRIKKLPFKTVVQISLDIAKGLSYLHSKKIVHRNVKTENLLLQNDTTVKLDDFGIARPEAEDMTGRSGTVYYMAPEVIVGNPYNRKCDVYSFGICLWEIYCCKMPYAHLNDSDLLSGVPKKNLRPSIPRCCPSALAKIMRRCWDANPANRPEMEEVVRELQALNLSKGGGMVPENKKAFGCFCLAPHGS